MFPTHGLGWFAAIAVLPLLSGCDVTKTQFQNTAGGAGGELAAAATTLQYVHEGRLNRAYASSAFASYRDALLVTEKQLPSVPGAPDAATIAELLKLYRPAYTAVEDPCLDDSCDWRAQVDALKKASEALVNAADQ
ncbi:MAG: hypothetical protein M3O87_05595 [Candidatus Dormibacteraeota bacterium]|nr:hypothetical protein [Candidatus Dormibacteraeota bacterium]